MRDPALRWTGEHDGTIAYAFEGRSGADQKNPPAKDLYKLMTWPKMKRVGLPLTIAESAAILAKARLMVTICSGMSHICHSVKTPMIIIQYSQLVRPWHPPEDDTWQMATGTDDAMRRIEQALKATT
jgi:ADP-heptose:LPS heptosyltransferase